VRTQIQRRSLDGESFDIAIIGGGINGVAIARQCAAAGRRILLVEQNDFASGTTSRSTRIIHGGLRYLEHGEIGLVRESLRERERLLQTKPHLVRPMQFLLALPPGRRSALEVRFGLWLYRRCVRGRRAAKPAEDIACLERSLDGGQCWSVFHYEDAQCEFPERLVAEWLSEALTSGAEARNYTHALQVEVADGRVRGLRLRDSLNDTEYRITVNCVVNATGPWADAVAQRAGMNAERMVGGVRGSHLVLPRFPGAPQNAVYTEALDGRPVFVIPWNEQLLVGTTEVDDSGDPGRAQPSETETEYLLASVRRLFPSAPLGRNEIRYAMAGVRPLPFSPGNRLAAITRRHVLHDHGDDGAAGMISVIGGKLTTAAAVARECARKLGIAVVEPQLAAIIHPGEVENAFSTVLRGSNGHRRLSAQAARATLGWFGQAGLEIVHAAAGDEQLSAPLCDGSPHMVAEAVHALRHECAVTLADVLLRRVPVALAGWWSPAHTRQAADRIGAIVGWNDQRLTNEIEEFERERDQFLVKASVSLCPV
jgi:glycerol-3-phosphate dehydrogenase